VRVEEKNHGLLMLCMHAYCVLVYCAMLHCTVLYCTLGKYGRIFPRLNIFLKSFRFKKSIVPVYYAA
jgi:hypothetical protein